MLSTCVYALLFLAPGPTLGGKARWVACGKRFLDRLIDHFLAASFFLWRALVPRFAASPLRRFLFSPAFDKPSYAYHSDKNFSIRGKYICNYFLCAITFL